MHRIPGTAFGASLHHELKLLVDAGLSPVEALKAATSVTAGAFELTGRGCLQVGCRADLVLIDGDPTADITATTRTAGVWKNGHPVSLERETLKLTQEPSGEVVPISFLDHAAHWMASSDSYMGGESTATIAFVEDTLKVEGALNPGFPFPYAGAMWTPGEQPHARRRFFRNVFGCGFSLPTPNPWHAYQVHGLQWGYMQSARGAPCLIESRR